MPVQIFGEFVRGARRRRPESFFRARLVSGAGIDTLQLVQVYRYRKRRIIWEIANRKLYESSAG